MKALRLELFQETACYKKPFAFKVGETYPLPPYSTVKGMLHSLLNAEKFIPMELSIQGSYETIVEDYQTHYLFKKAGVQEFPLVLDGLGYTPEYEAMTKMPLYTHLLYNVKLIIHVKAQEDVLHGIDKNIRNATQHLSLGRWEDLVRIDDCCMVELVENTERIRTRIPAFVPIGYLDEWMNYIPFRLNWKYNIKNGVREWEKIKAGYVDAGVTFEKNTVLVENLEDGYPVFLNLGGSSG